MWMLLLACSVGSPDPAPTDSKSAQIAAQAQTISDQAGAVANAARELEQMADPARERVAAGEDPSVHMQKMREKMAQIEALEAALQAEVEAFEAALVVGD